MRPLQSLERIERERTNRYGQVCDTKAAGARHTPWMQPEMYYIGAQPAVFGTCNATLFISRDDDYFCAFALHGVRTYTVAECREKMRTAATGQTSVEKDVSPVYITGLYNRRGDGLPTGVTGLGRMTA